MAHFAKVENGLVTQIIVAEQDFINSGAVGEPSLWIQTSYNTFEGIHILGGQPLRKNFAGVGYTYDSIKDAFIPPQPFKSWLLNENTCAWVAPIEFPNDGSVYVWDESTISWVKND